jgi:signal transduction histidine kinase/ActR/RegA family two-component response regulator
VTPALSARVRELLVGTALAVVYVAAAHLGLSLAFSVRQVSPVWPPTGIAIAVLLRLGPRYWPAIAVGALVANLGTGAPIGAAAGIALGNTLEAVAGAALLRRAAGRDLEMVRLREFVALLAAAVMASAVSATFGTASLALWGLLPAAATVASTWLVWWVGDAMGALVIAPFLLTWSRPLPSLPSRSWLVESAVVGTLFSGVTVAIFEAALPADPIAASLEYVVFPFMIWAALRLGPRGVTTFVALVSAVAIHGAIHDRGPFTTGSLTQRLVLLQLFMAVVTMTALALAALVSERRRAGEERARLLAAERASRIELEAANAGKDEFLAVLSHEMRTPLTPILGWTRMLREGVLDAPTSAHALEVIERNAVLQSRLVEDLLDASRIVTGRMTLERQPVDLTALVRGALTLFGERRGHRGVALVDHVGDESVFVLGDRERLQQAIANVLQNAFKFTPGGGSVEVSLRADRACADLRVRDTGHGIDPAFLPRVFMPFTQGESGTTRSYGGLGLGLAIVRHVVEQHGGSVSAESEGPGHGTTIVLRLPRAECAAACPAPAVASGVLRLADVKVLVVDDEPDTRDFLATILGRAGAEFEVASSAAEALALLDTWRPDVLVSDIGMAGQDGLDLIRAVRGRDPEHGGCIPAVVLTAYAGREDGQRAREAGFDVHVSKPVHPDDLVAALARVVMGRTAPPGP